MAVDERIRDIVECQVRALSELAESDSSSYSAACKLLLDTRGRLIVTGVGKSGHIGAKLAATFASTGTNATFVHAGEAAHGDLGMITAADVVLAISVSGSSSEIIPIIEYCREFQIPIIAVTARERSTLGAAAKVALVIPESKEVCPNNLAPTTSMTLVLVMGHILAVLLMEARSFGKQDFARYHPGGLLGLQLQTVGKYLSLYPEEVATVESCASIEDVISKIATGLKGCVAVVEDGDGSLCGVITEGDLRRAYSEEMFSKTARDIMSTSPITILPSESIYSCVEVFKSRRISQILVCDSGRVAGIVHVKDLMQRGYF